LNANSFLAAIELLAMGAPGRQQQNGIPCTRLSGYSISLPLECVFTRSQPEDMLSTYGNNKDVVGADAVPDEFIVFQ
jgi:hypothetical protein